MLKLHGGLKYAWRKVMKMNNFINHFIKKNSNAIIPILIAVLTVLIYSNTLSSSFHFDDIRNIEQNDKLLRLSNFLNISGTRYVGELSFALNYYLGKFDVLGYHIVNLIIHILNSILVWRLVNLTFKTPVMGKTAVNQQLNSLIALSSALIFVAHPIQTQAVTYIVQRFASLATLFYLLSIVLFVKWRLSVGFRYRAVFYIFSLLSAVVAMKTKEISFTLPLIIFIYEFAFFRDVRGILRRTFTLIPYLLTILIIPLSMIGIAKPVGEIVGDVGRVAQETEKISRASYLLTQFRVIATYIRLLFLPVDQNLDYDYPIYHSFFTPVVFLSFLFLLFIFGIGVYLFMRSRRGGNGYAMIASFGIFWFFITLSVESSIIPISDVIFEHRLYLPGIGAVVAISTAILYGVEYLKKQAGMDSGSSSLYVSCVVIFAMVLPLSFATHQRNRIWKDEITLWRDVVIKSPLKARAHNILGNVYNNMEHSEDAIEEFRTAIRLRPEHAETHYNLGLAYDKTGRTEEAMEELRTAIKLKPDYPEAHNNLGVIYAKKGRREDAMEEFKTVIKINPLFAEAHNNLGFIYNEMNQKEKALVEVKIALEIRPDDPEAQDTLRKILQK